jgi:CubicO group peptidase (beta-lactamase class C family)
VVSPAAAAPLRRWIDTGDEIRLNQQNAHASRTARENGMTDDDPRIHGTCDPRFAAVRDVFAGHLTSGLEVGASVAVALDGELVVDLWGGFADGNRSRAWERDTIVNVFSTTKTMMALVALMLADRGALDLDAPVARYWPEFAANGKRDVRVRHLLSHTSGLSGWEEPVAIEDLYDWDKATGLLAAQAPWWKPGSASGYHALSQGFLVGEVVRRITGTTLGRFFAEEIAAPLGADFHIGLPAEHDARVARVVPPVTGLPTGNDRRSLAIRTLANPPLRAESTWTEGWRRAELAAVNGHGNARSVAAIQSVLACGGTVGGRRVLSAPGCDAAFAEQSNGTDLVLGVPIRFGMGYGLRTPLLSFLRNDRTCFWGGWGGSLVVVDCEARLVVAYAMNRMGEGTLGDERGAALVMAAYGALAA